jgi:hypothetical protein
MIFLSYSWADAGVARALYSKIATSAKAAWIDYYELDLRRAIEPQLVDAVARATAVVLIDSNAARRSHWVEFELSLARRAGVPIVVQPTEYLAERLRSNSDVEADVALSRCAPSGHAA